MIQKNDHTHRAGEKKKQKQKKRSVRTTPDSRTRARRIPLANAVRTSVRLADAGNFGLTLTKDSESANFRVCLQALGFDLYSFVRVRTGPLQPSKYVQKTFIKT